MISAIKSLLFQDVLECMHILVQVYHVEMASGPEIKHVWETFLTMLWADQQGKQDQWTVIIYK